MDRLLSPSSAVVSTHCCITTAGLNEHTKNACCGICCHCNIHCLVDCLKKIRPARLPKFCNRLWNKLGKSVYGPRAVKLQIQSPGSVYLCKFAGLWLGHVNNHRSLYCTGVYLSTSASIDRQRRSNLGTDSGRDRPRHRGDKHGRRLPFNQVHALSRVQAVNRHGGLIMYDNSAKHRSNSFTWT